jgi:hypothetical protein
MPRRVGIPTAKTGFLGRSMSRGGREAIVRLMVLVVVVRLGR